MRHATQASIYENTEQDYNLNDDEEDQDIFRYEW